MASIPATSPDTLINLKVNHDGFTKKLKLPLRDLGASALEDKLRVYLGIPPTTICRIERYSDSAASYVLLDPTNISVYKQLYRAAKAKQKLKLRVMTENEEVEKEPKKSPKPVTVEDVPEAAEASEAKPVDKTDKPSAPNFFTLPPLPMDQRLRRSMNSVMSSEFTPFAPEADLDAQLSQLGRNHEGLEKNIAQLQASVAQLSMKASPSPPLARSPAPAVKRVSVTPVAVVPVELSSSKVPLPAPVTNATFAVCCNKCGKNIPESHYHCSTCDDGDFDLCQDCVDQGITCLGEDHWLIKRFIKNGIIVNSTTEKIAPKVKVPKPSQTPRPFIVERVSVCGPPTFDIRSPPTLESFVNVRTCNNCIGELPESQFLHCTTCEDFDLCEECFTKNEHGHHPKHGFVAAADGLVLDPQVSARLAPGRNQKHNAVCDGCDEFITGVRHKCLDCPDWDYCSECVVNAGFIHPNHRFVPVYEPIREIRTPRSACRATHYGICCDGPLCNPQRGGSSIYIVGDRYKCAVCHNTDFCANCEASPANVHNKTHPLIKFKTPVRHVSVTTTGEDGEGKRMQTMGDRTRNSFASSQSRATETTLTEPPITMNNVQTIVDVRPSEPSTPVKVENEAAHEEAKPVETEPEEPVAPKEPSAADLIAVYERDTVADGTVLVPNHVFEQTWVLRNAGTVAWPAGCRVRFVNGDDMRHIDRKHPTGIHELVSASETTICYEPLAPGEEFAFTVLLKSPASVGKAISYWRLATEDGVKFGHRLWCDINVQAPTPKEKEPESVSTGGGLMFPKLEKESPVSSVHEDVQPEAVPVEEEAEDFEDCEDDEWARDDSDADNGFLTDEEYDILDASDEEYLEEQQKKVLKN